MLLEEQAAAYFCDAVERHFQLRPAIAAQAMEYVSGEALGVDPDQRGRFAGDIAHFQHHGLFHPIALALFEAENAEAPEAAGEIGFGDLSESLP
jgi:hypothetical protein